MRFSARGFTLFTALVGFVLIGLGFLLANSMLHSEDHLQQTIASIDEQSEMQSLSDLMQADAFQYLNWYLRVMFEKFVTDSSYSYELNAQPGNDLQVFIDDFSGGLRTPLANFLSLALTNSFPANGRAFKNYRVCLVSCNANEQAAWNANHANKLNQSLQRLIDEEIRQKKLIEPIDCPNCENGNCKNGSFYINLDLTLRDERGNLVITDSDLEDFPQISIESLASGRVIRQPILTRNYFRIYIPNRFMKAICSASEVAKNNLFSSSSTGSDRLRKMGLGFCDTGCHPRTDPFTEQISPTVVNNYICPGTRVQTCLPGSPGSCKEDRLSDIQVQANRLKQVAATCADESCEPFFYDPGNTEDMRQKLQNLLGSAITNSIVPATNGQNYGPEQNFTLEVDNSILNFTRVQSQEFKTKIIKLDYPEVQRATSGEGEAYCVRPVQVGAIVGFRERDSKYQVLHESTLGKNHVYRILIGSGLRPEDVSGITVTTCTSKLVPNDPGLFPPTAVFTSVKCGPDSDGFNCQCTP